MRILADKRCMTTAQYLAKYYDIMKKISNPIEAKEMVSGVVYIVVSEILDEGLEVTPEILEKRIAKHIEDYIKVAKKTKVA